METVVAEKLEAIVSLGMLNSRMKDFFDLNRENRYLHKIRDPTDFFGILTFSPGLFLLVWALIDGNDTGWQASASSDLLNFVKSVRWLILRSSGIRRF